MTSGVGAYRQVFGTGQRHILALHCTLGHAGNWRGFAQALGDQYRVTALDLPGHGRNAPCPPDADFHDLCTTHAKATLQAPVDLVGHSFGATVALRLALEHPQMVRSLTLIEPVLFVAIPREASAELKAYLAAMKPFQSALEQGDTELAARLFNRYWGDGTKWHAFSQTGRRYMADRIALVPRQEPSIIDDNPGFMAAGRLEGLHVPCLILEGGQTVPVIRSVHDALEKRLPDVRRRIISDAGHMLVLTHCAEVAAAAKRLFEVT